MPKSAEKEKDLEKIDEQKGKTVENNVDRESTRKSSVKHGKASKMKSNEENSLTVNEEKSSKGNKKVKEKLSSTVIGQEKSSTEVEKVAKKTTKKSVTKKNTKNKQDGGKAIAKKETKANIEELRDEAKETTKTKGKKAVGEKATKGKEVGEKKAVKVKGEKIAGETTTEQNKLKEETKIIELNVEEDKEHERLIKFEDIKNIFKKKRKLPKEALSTVIKPVFHNIIAAIVVIVYFIFLILGFYNIENSVYEVDLKVFAMCILFIAIMLLEKAYKDDNGKIAAFGIETIVISMVTLGLIYVNLMFSSYYITIVLTVSYILAIYYMIKSIVIYQKGKNDYFVDNMKEIMKTDE